jgi:hypothetical protein
MTSTAAFLIRTLKIGVWACLAAMAACGGSSSETPWPAEPLNTDPGPAGENIQRGNVIDTATLPNNYGKGGGGGVGENGTGGDDASSEDDE